MYAATAAIVPARVFDGMHLQCGCIKPTGALAFDTALGPALAGGCHTSGSASCLCSKQNMQKVSSSGMLFTNNNL